MFSNLDVTKNFHHAFLLEGERENIFQALLDFLNEKLGFSPTANPDFWLGEFDSLGIDDSREIKEFQSRRAFSGGKKILVVKTNFITHEAQNSLLKVFEEPTEDTHIFLIVPSAEGLLPTLKSRLMLIKDLDVGRPNPPFGRPASKLGVGKFLEASVAERFELIKVFLPKTKESLNLLKSVPKGIGRSGKDKISKPLNLQSGKAEAINFLNELEQVLYKKFQQERTTACLPDRQASPSPSEGDRENIFSEIRQCRSYLRDRSPAVKMILEHLSQIIK